MSSTSDEDESVQNANGDTEGLSGSLKVPLLQYSSVILPATRVTPAFLEQHQAVCTACRTRVPHLRTRRLRVHPTLCTIVCRKCEEKLIAIFKSTTGIDGRRCHWCVTPILQEPSNSASAVLAEKGGARCNNVQCGQFVCRSCLKQNLTRDQLHAVRVSQEKGEWKCFRCNPQLIRPHQLYAATVAEYVRVRRRPVLLASPATNNDEVHQNLTDTKTNTFYGLCQQEVEKLSSSARSLVEACALYTTRQDGQSSLINQLEEHILLAGRFLKLQSNHDKSPQGNVSSATGDATFTDAPMGSILPVLDYDEKNVLIDVIRQQNEARKGQQSDEQRFQKLVHPENFNDQSTPVGENTAGRGDTSLVSSESALETTENTKGTLNTPASTALENILAPSNIKNEIDPDEIVYDEVASASPKSIKEKVSNDNHCLPVNTIDFDNDSKDSNATVDLPLVPNKRFNKQRLSNSSKIDENIQGTAHSDNDEDCELQSLLADIEPRRIVQHQHNGKKKPGPSGNDTNGDLKPKSSDAKVKKEMSGISKSRAPFASSDEEAGGVGGLNLSQPCDYGPIIVLSECEGLSDLMSDEDDDEDDDMEIYVEEDESQDSHEHSHSNRSLSVSEHNTREDTDGDVMQVVDERDDKQDRGPHTEGSNVLSNKANGTQNKKVLLKRLIPSMPMADTDASNSEDEEKSGACARLMKPRRKLSNVKRRLSQISSSEDDSSSNEWKRPRIGSDNQLELSSTRTANLDLGSEISGNPMSRTNDNPSGSTDVRPGDPVKSATVSKTKLPQDVLVVMDSDDDVIVSKEEMGHGKQKKVATSVPPVKKFSKQAIKAEFDPCVISSDDDEPATQRLTFPSVSNGIQSKGEIPAPGSAPTGRRNIREVMDENKLSGSTREANAAERERRQRIEELQNKYNQFERSFEQMAGPDGGKCVLEYDMTTKKPLVEVHPSLARRLKKHQSEGIKFLYRNLIETVSRLKCKEACTGAILAHCMGLGKTFQVICLVHTLLTHPLLKEHFKTVLVVCPLNVVNAWRCEIEQWIKRDDTIQEKFMLYNLHHEKDQILRESLMSKWTRSGGVLLITPNLLTVLLGAETEAGQRKRQRLLKLNKNNAARVKPNSASMNKMKSFLWDPGASVVVVDEGHTLKNSDTQVTQVVQMMKTRRKILLTGTPLQNNLVEYYTMVSLVSPDLLGTKQEFKNRFENPISNGQYKNSTVEDIQKMRRRASVLNKLLNNVVQRRDMSVLASILPPRQDYVLTIRLSPLQERLYSEFLGMLIKRAEEQPNNNGPTFKRLLQDFVLLRSTWTHPKLLVMPRKTCPKKQKVATLVDMLVFDSITPEQDAQLTQKDWYRPHLEGTDLDDIALGPKLFILFDIIQQCTLIEDKLVVFCTQLSALDLIEYLLRLMHENRIGGHSWVKNKDFFRMDGTTTAEDRQRFFGMFNDPDKPWARLFLVSTNAGKLGSTLIGANRMVLLDTSWNPSDDNQAVYRIYRIGQTKPVYIYRFVSFGTMEEKIYARNILKESTQHRVLDDSNMERHFTHEDVRDLYLFTPYEESEKVLPPVPKDRLLAELILRQKDNIVKVHEHQQMLQNLEDDLSEEDRRIAWEEYQREKDAPPGQQGAQESAGDTAFSKPPALLVVADQLLGQVAQFSAIFNNPNVPEEDKRKMIGQYLKKTKQARDKYEQVTKIDHQMLTECIRLKHPLEVTNKIVSRRQIVNSKIELLNEELRQINDFIKRLQQTPIRRALS
ncbi:transcriptional regulator ATRX homolog isoform X2 [Varroa destructor]|nr:transcriptional regulator ATRX homolog isoform X2 [Varroa destructor]XP_022652461.1 transcriptional regulator ATRX homolog isoform X2 [Varroa destructor]XP_022652462.1 transcriptional regulator ATRX homolog isoform X2 [Varroa destructor]